MSDTETTRRGKIARLPQTLREELNLRLLNGETGAKILAWLNALPTVTTILAEQFGGEPVTDSNLSNWRAGGYEDWRKKRERVEYTKELSRFSTEMARAANGALSGGALSIAGGKILETLELIARADLSAGSVAGGADDGAESSIFSVKTLKELTDAAVSLRIADQNDTRLKQNDRKLDLAAKRDTRDDRILTMDERKFAVQFADGYMKWFDDRKAREIMASGKDTQIKREELITLMFGARPGGPKTYGDEEAA